MSPHHRHGGGDRGADVVVGRVEQGAADDQAAHRRQTECLLPAGERLVGVGADRRRAAGSAAWWTPSRGPSRRRPAASSRCTPTWHPRPWPMCTDLITASGLRSLRTLPLTRVDMNGSSMAIRPVRGEFVDRLWRRPPWWRRCRDRRGRCGTASFRRSSSPPRSTAAVAPVIRSSSSKDAPARPPRLNEENTTLSSSAPSSSRSSRMSDGGEHAVDAGVGERGAQPVEQVGAAVHRGRPVADGERAAGGVVGGDDHQPAVAADRSGGWCGSPRRGRRRRDRRRAGR